MRIVVMADDTVGRAVVDFLTRHHPKDLSAVMVTDPVGRSASADEIRAQAAPHVPVVAWSEREQIRMINPDVILLAWWPKILKSSDLALAPLTLNLHPSLLPHCRGSDPNFWAIVERRPFGVTIHHVEAAIDAGPIAFQRQIATDWTSTGQSLYDLAQAEIIRLFVDSYPAIAAGDIPRITQNIEAGSFHRRAELEPASILDLDAPTTAREVLDRIRARTFPPHRACRFFENDEYFEVTVSIRRLPRDEAQTGRR